MTGSHLTSMHSMDNYYVSQADPADAPRPALHAVANPLINITLQGRHDSYPKRRGMTRVPELMAAGVNVGFGHDCVMDPWYPLGSGDMLEVAQMGLHVAQMTSLDGMRACFDAVTVNNARVLGLPDYGLEPGKPADCVLLQAAFDDRGDPPAGPPPVGDATRQSDCPLAGYELHRLSCRAGRAGSTGPPRCASDAGLPSPQLRVMAKDLLR